jgi:hypothetical protein
VGWFSASRSRQLPAELAPPTGHHSLALKPLLETLHPESRHAVLDLGPPLGVNLEFLSGLSCRVCIADLYRSLFAESVESRAPEARAGLFERLLPLGVGERFDAVLTWDLFNYLRRDQVSSLMGRLGPACRPGALVLALVWNRGRIPAEPLRYRILDRENLAWDGPLEPVRAGPRWGERDFGRMMPGFSVHRSFLLRNGIQEYLFARDPPPRQSKIW